MSKENLKQSPRAKHLLAHLGSWAAEVKQFQDLQFQQDALEQIKLAYLSSDFANNKKERNESLVLFTQFNNVYQLLMKYTDADFKELDELILKLLEPCTTETIN